MSVSNFHCFRFLIICICYASCIATTMIQMLQLWWICDVCIFFWKITLRPLAGHKWNDRMWFAWAELLASGCFCCQGLKTSSVRRTAARTKEFMQQHFKLFGQMSLGLWNQLCAKLLHCFKLMLVMTNVEWNKQFSLVSNAYNFFTKYDLIL